MQFRYLIFRFVCCFLLGCGWQQVDGQQQKPDTFFLARKKGILGTIGRSIQTGTIEPPEPSFENPYLMHSGKRIRYIRYWRMSLEGDVNDTAAVHQNFTVRIANKLHERTRHVVVRNNLFFQVGDSLNPYLLADNERHLRDLPYFQDARILVNRIAGNAEAVDILVITKDVFSIGASLDIKGTSRIRVNVSEDNIAGSGNRFEWATLFDVSRKPRMGWGGNFLKRNIGGSFINWQATVNTFSSAFNSGRMEELLLNTSFEKPLVSAYMRWTGGVNYAFHKTNDSYLNDSSYLNNYRYAYHQLDGWIGYNFGRGKNAGMSAGRVRRFLAARALMQHFLDIPYYNISNFDYRYTNLHGVLGAFSLFRQDFYRAKFIYGFGRNEDIPQGFSGTVTAGWIRQQDSFRNEVRPRAYYGLDFQRNHYNDKGFYSAYTIRAGGYWINNRFEDISMLFNVEHFSRLHQLTTTWYQRFYIGCGFTQQYRTVLNAPLLINSAFGLPYFKQSRDGYDFRAGIKSETVFFHLRSFWGFRMAPFAFADIVAVNQPGEHLNKTEFFSAVGSGLRIRNENLVFGTIELKGFFFPRSLPEMGNFRFQIGTNIRFKYNSNLIRKPDFIQLN